MYTPPRPPDGQPFGDLFSAWPDEKITFVLGEPITGMLQRNELPADKVKWTADDHTAQNNVTEFAVQWATAGIKHVDVQVGTSTYHLYVNIPNTGSYDLNSSDLKSLVGTITWGRIGAAGLSTRDEIIARYGEDPGTGRTRQDAIRHSTWNAVCAQSDIGKAKTLLVTTANEYHGRYFGGQLASNCTMDLNNNAVGASVGDAYFNASQKKTTDQLITELEAKFSNGELYAWTPPNANVSTHFSILRKSNQAKIFTP